MVQRLTFLKLSNLSKLSALVLAIPTLAFAQAPPPPTSPQPPSANTGGGSSQAPFNVQMPPSQGGLPSGVLPPTQNYTPGQIPINQGNGGFVPMALPPSSGGLNTNQNQNAPVNMYNVSPSSGPTWNQPEIPTRSEIIQYDPKKEKKSVLVVKTSEGEFKITLKSDIAPINVENFVDLALGQKEFIDVRTSKKVKRPFYTGLNCHRVIRSVLIQCGCPFGNGHGGPGFTVNDERSSGMKFDRPGVVAMALAQAPNSGNSANGQQGQGLGYAPNTAGSQFFISLGPLPDYNDQFTVIGQITSGMDTIRKIASTPTGPTDRPIKRVIIFSIDPDLPPITPLAPMMDPMMTPMGDTPIGAPIAAPQIPPATTPGLPAAPTFPEGAIDPFAMPPPEP